MDVDPVSGDPGDVVSLEEHDRQSEAPERHVEYDVESSDDVHGGGGLVSNICSASSLLPGLFRVRVHTG